MNKRKNNNSPLKIAVLGHKTIPSRQGGIEIVVEELTVRMAKLGHKITVYNRSGHHVSNCLWAFQKELLDESENIRFGKTVWEATKVVAVFSFMIEFTQLLFHLGTFQISDLTYNTLDGAVGGVVYYLGYFRKQK